MNQIKIEITASMVAWYGATVASFTALLGILNYLRDRGKIEVKVSEGYIIPFEIMGDKEKIFIEAINHGRRPITLASVGFTLKNKKHLYITEPTTDLPCELTEGRSIQVYVDKEELKNKVLKQKTKITKAWYKSSTNKIYKTRFKLKLENKKE